MLIPHTNWNNADTALAHAEGWEVFDNRQIKRTAHASPFADDDAAVAHVRTQAATGSLTHRLAVFVHDMNARPAREYRFGSRVLAPVLFDLTCARLLQHPTSTPEEVRLYLQKHGKAELAAISASENNQNLVVDRVFRHVRNWLRDAGLLVVFKRGVWATARFMAAE